MKSGLLIMTLFFYSWAFAGEEHEEGSPLVGPEKGIIAKSDRGFKLAPEAVQTFKIQTAAAPTKVLKVPSPALVKIKNGRFLYLVRDGWFARVPVKVLKKDKHSITVEIPQLHSGDAYVTEGVGFVRTTEILTGEGASHGHSH